MRRLVTLIPALVILAIGVDPSRALVLSQVVLSFGIPFALVPLVRLTSDRAADGRRHQPPGDHRARLGASPRSITVLNVVLIYLIFVVSWLLNAYGVTPTSRTGPTCACGRWRDAAPAPPTRARRRWPTTTG